MQSADPTNPCLKPVPYTGIQFVLIPEFQSFGGVVGQNISGALADKLTVEQALKDSQAAVGRAVKQAGYQK
jgi:sorbitol/mannitol transport system substrate-binding protein